MLGLPSGPGDASTLASNSLEDLMKCNELLTKVVGNILAHPMEAKYRTIKTTNAKFNKDVWSLDGAPDFVLAMGFKLNGDSIVFPEGTPFTPLTAGLAQLQALCTYLEEKQRLPPPDAPPPTPIDVAMRQTILEEIRREKRKRLGRDLSANTLETLEDTFATLHRIFSNIADHPGDEKYTRIRTTNAQFRRTVLDVPGGEAFMTDAGFIQQTVDDVDWLVLPSTADMTLFNHKFQELKTLQEENSRLLEAQQERQRAESREAMRKMKLAMMQQLRASTGGPVPPAPDTSVSSSSGGLGAPAAADIPLTSQQQLLRRLLGGADNAKSRENELEWKALQLVEDIAVLMEFHARLAGETTYRAEWNIEKRRLYEKFKADRDIAYLHEIKEEWEEKVQQLKRKTGKVFIDLEVPLPEKTDDASDSTSDMDAAVEERYKQMLRK